MISRAPAGGIAAAFVLGALAALAAVVFSSDAAPLSAQQPPPTPTRPPSVRPSSTPTPRPSPTPSPSSTIAPRPTSTPIPPTAVPTATPAIIMIAPTKTPPGAVAVPTPGLPLVAVTPEPTDFPIAGPPPTKTLPSFSGGDVVQDLVATALEVTQGMQDKANHMPLVEDRWTYVRVYVRSKDTPHSISNVKGALGAWRNGQYIGTAYPENGPIIAHPTGGDRVELDDSLYFVVPLSWRHGVITFRAFVYAGTPDAPSKFEPDAMNNLKEVTLEFHPADPLQIRLVPIHVHEGYASNGADGTYTFLENFGAAVQVVLGVYRLEPISQLTIDPSPSFLQIYEIPFGGFVLPIAFYVTGGVKPIGHSDGEEWNLSLAEDRSKPNERIGNLKSHSPEAVQSWAWYGMLGPTFSMGGPPSGGVYTGWAKPGGAYGKMDPAFDPQTMWDMAGGGTLAHEIAHGKMPGDDHNDCSGTEEEGGALDPNYPFPFPNCSIAALDSDGYYGFDVYWLFFSYISEPTVISNDPNAPEPNHAFPLMGYKGEKYLDPYNYCKLLDAYGVPCDPNDIELVPDPTFGREDSGRGRYVSAHHHAPGAAPDGHAPVAASGGIAADEGHVYVSAQADPVTGAAELLAAERLIEPAQGVLTEAQERRDRRAGQPTGFELTFDGATGQTIALYPLIDDGPPPHDLKADSALTILSDIVPYPEQTAFVRIRRLGAVVAERAVSGSAPVVRLLEPNGGEPLSAPFDVLWEASDPDGDELSFTVQYSADGGVTWQAIATDLRGAGMRATSTGGFAGTDQGRFRVIASDGVHTASDDSDGLFVMPASAPTPYIFAPGDGASYPTGATVRLMGGAFDLEDGPLAADALRWQSSIDGDLGAGDEIDSRALSAGTHTITLTATDATGASSDTSVEITIDADRVVALPDEDEREGIARGLGLAGDDDGPPVALIAGIAAGAVALLAAAGFGVWRWRARAGEQEAAP